MTVMGSLIDPAVCKIAIIDDGYAEERLDLKIPSLLVT